MGIIDTVRSWLGVDDDDPPFVCLNCGAGHERKFAECPSCGNPYVVPTDDEGET